MRFVPGALLAGGLGFAVSLILAACGGGGTGLLSGDQANTLNAQLDRISSAVNSRNCGAALQASQGFGSQVAALPPTVNPTLRADLNQGAATVSNLAARDCRKATTPTTPTATTATTTTSTTTTSTSQSTTTTETHPTTTTTTTSSSTATTSPSGGGGLPTGQGGSGGAGSGQGQGQ